MPSPIPRASTCSCCTWPTPGQRGLLPTPARPRAPGRLSSYAAFALEGGHTLGLWASHRVSPPPPVSGHRSEVAFTVADDDAVRPARALADAGRAHRATTCRRSLRIDLRRPGSRRSSHPRLPALNVAVFTPVQDPARRPREHGGFARNRAMHDPTAAGGPSNRPPRPRPSRRKVVIVVSAGLALGQAANAAARIAAGLGAACRLAARPLRDGRTAIIRYLAPAHHHPQRQ